MVVKFFLCVKDFILLPRLSTVMSTFIPKTHCLLKIDWALLLKQRLDHQDQDHVDPHRVDMGAALAMCVGLDPWKNSQNIRR